MKTCSTVLLLVLGITSASADVVVMTHNVLHGADFGPVISAISSNNGPAIISTSAAAYQQVQASLYSERADAIAAEIQASGAALVGLQEVGLFRSGTFGDAASATQVEQDYLGTLMTALSNRGLSYTAAVVQENVDIEVPSMVDGVNRDLRFTNRNVILARTDLAASEFSFSNPTQTIFQDGLPIGGGQFIDSGFTSLDVQANGTSFRFINTHLESDSSSVRVAQGNELLSEIQSGSLPVVLVGDLNTTPGATTYSNLTGGGLTDAWDAVNPGQPGYTFGTALTSPTPTFDRRIDFVMTTGVLEATSAEVVGDELADRTPSGLWPSDHAGVVVSLSTVPEPSSVLVLALGGVAIAGRQRRQRRQTADG